MLLQLQGIKNDIIYRNKFIHQLHRLEKIKTLSHDSYKRLYLMKIEKVHIIFLSLALCFLNFVKEKSVDALV